MDQADKSPIPSSASLQRISQPEPGARVRFSGVGVGLWPSCPTRNGDLLVAVPDGGSRQDRENGRSALLADLRARIAAIERHSFPQSLPSPSHSGRAPLPPPPSSSPSEAWCLGVPQIDAHLSGGLDAGGVHEIKPARDTRAAAGAWAAAFGFALRLAVRRASAAGAPILWCWPSALARELGAPYGPGLAGLGLAPSQCLFVETQRADDALWAMEEGLKSASLALVVGALPQVALTPARRLSLAAAGGRTPCLMITDPRTPAAGSTATRWRIGAAPSAPHILEAGAPGAARYAVRLERCRARAAAGLGEQVSSLLVEWSDATRRFRMAPRLADRALGARHAVRGAR